MIFFRRYTKSIMKNKLLLSFSILLLCCAGFILYQYINRSYHPPLADVEMTILQSNPLNESDKAVISKNAYGLKGVTACAVNSKGLICITHQKDIDDQNILNALIKNTGFNLQVKDFSDYQSKGECPLNKFSRLFDF